jgi:predicted regulator of Ras-like GTPase activity (Roadblock/LC7/MglB family)
VDSYAQPPSTGKPATLKDIMHAMYETGRFQAAILASYDGLPIATEPPGFDPQVAAATVAMLRKVGSDTQQQLGMAELDEATIRSRDGVRLASRCLTAGGQKMILIAIVLPGCYYRRATSRTIRQIKQLLS